MSTIEQDAKTDLVDHPIGLESVLGWSFVTES